MEVTIPTEDVVRLLAGKLTAEELFGSYACGPPDYLGMLQKRPPLLAAEVIQGDPKNRVPSKIKLTLGDPLPPVVQGTKGPA